ncbi:hypothetical protein K2173_027635 [Erythroxylum novogranatense]|uniref:Uncharacterized protein n=1 Tax=Erythroxylum novogranatense TaxID=1862640 RepID=A0AAV8U3I0_9ROSI|nr:hypothetical protein K2173_027635 [Erythroxylum novogranatense]
MSRVGTTEQALNGSVSESGGQLNLASSNGYGPWTQVQRKRHPPLRGQGQPRGSLSQTGQSHGGSRFAVLINEDTVAEQTIQQDPNQHVVLPVGMGQRLSVFSFKETGKTTQQTGPSKFTDRPRGPARGAKGKGLNTIAQPQVDPGQSSAGSSQASVPGFAAVAEGPLNMEEVADPEAAPEIHELSTSEPLDIPMDSVGHADCSEPHPPRHEVRLA